MDRVIDHDFLMQALNGFQYIISFINNHKVMVDTEISNILKENPSYKFKDSKSLQLEIENEIVNKQLVERFNSHDLNHDEIQKLRRLAFEKSMITIRLFELN